jgi:hypothetical protein
MDQLIGGLTTFGIGVIIVAVIYQLTTNPGSQNLVNQTVGPSGIGQATLSALFK